MRLFLAIDSSSLKTYFSSLQQSLPTTQAKHTNTFHLTLKFLGEMNPSVIPKMVEELKKVTKRPFSVTIDHIGYFSDNSALKVIWAGFSDKHNIITLQKRIDEALKQWKPIQKKYLPHITLARIKKQSHGSIREKKFLKKGIQVESFEAFRHPVEKKTFSIKEFHLIKSDIKSTGPEYTILETFQLE